MEDAEWQYLLNHIEEDETNGIITVKVEENATIPPLDITDWTERYLTADSINNYCRKYTNKDDDPDSTALKICGKIRDTLERKDRTHNDPEHVCNIFMGCVRYHDLFPNGWDAETANRILSKVFGARTAREEAAERAEQSNQLAEAVAREQEKREKERRAARRGKPLILKTCGDLAEEASRRRVDYIGTDKHQTTTYFIEDQLRQTWYDITKAARIKESNGYVWFDGSEWHVDEQGRELSGAIAKNAQSVARELHRAWSAAGGGSGDWAALEGIRKMLMKISPDDITGLRQEPTISTSAVYKHGLTCTDGVIIIDAGGIHITTHNPHKEVWFGGVPLSTNDLLPNIESMTFDEVVNRFPHARESLEACGPDKVRLMATLAGIAIYYMMPNHKPLDGWYYLWDAGIGGTGKSRHMRMYLGFFGKYISSGVSWEVFTGEIEENGDFLGKIGVECEEAGVNDIKSAEKIKNRVTGDWELRIYYHPRVGIKQPLLLISLGNVKPLLSRVVNKEPIWDRLQPCEFTVKHRNTGKEFPCSDDEYHKFLLNIGCWVAAKLMTRGDKVCKKDLPYYVEPEEVEALCTRVPWFDILPDIGTWAAGEQSPLNAVYDCIKAELQKQGWTDADMKGAPELGSLNAFRRAIDGVTMQKHSNLGYPTGKGVLKVVGAGGELRKQSRHWVKNFRLTVDVPTESTPEGTPTEGLLTSHHMTKGEAELQTDEIRKYAGRIVVNVTTGAVENVEPDSGDHKGWNIEKYIERPDPLPDVKECGRFGRLIYKPAVFHVRSEGGRQTLINITAT